MRGTIGHEVLAGAIGSASILGGAITSPLLAPVVDLVSAAVTAGIAAHAVHSSAPEGGKAALRDAVRRSLEQPDAPLAAHVLDTACRVRARGPRAWRSLAMLVGRAFDARLREVMKSVEWVHSLTEPLEANVEVRVEAGAEASLEVEGAPPASGRFPSAPRVSNLESMEAA